MLKLGGTNIRHIQEGMLGNITFSSLKVSVINVISGAITCANPGLWGSLRSLTVRPKLLMLDPNKQNKEEKSKKTSYNHLSSCQNSLCWINISKSKKEQTSKTLARGDLTINKYLAKTRLLGL